MQSDDLEALYLVHGLESDIVKIGYTGKAVINKFGKICVGRTWDIRHVLKEPVNVYYRLGTRTDEKYYHSLHKKYLFHGKEYFYQHHSMFSDEWQFLHTHDKPFNFELFDKGLHDTRLPDGSKCNLLKYIKYKQPLHRPITERHFDYKLIKSKKMFELFGLFVSGRCSELTSRAYQSLVEDDRRKAFQCLDYLSEIRKHYAKTFLE
ncbi:MAG: hypothetical protein ACRDBG_24245 [Waterburya sp.]